MIARALSADALACRSTDVIPAKAGTHLSVGAGCEMGPSFRWDDIGGVA